MPPSAEPKNHADLSAISTPISAPTADVAIDVLMMRRAIALARGNYGKTATNPSVGCVITQRGEVVTQAVTAPGGRPHAEEQALAAAGEQARGATAYVTLEPCGARTSGATSCAEHLVRAGVARVVVACADASPFASGRGIKLLREAGVAVECGLLETEAAALLR